MTLRKWWKCAFAPGLALIAGVVAAPLSAQQAAESRAPFTLQGQTWVSQKAFVESGARCGTRPVDSIEAEEITRIVNRYRAARGLVERPAGSVTVGVWVHVINKGTGIANGDVPQSQIDAFRASLHRSTPDKPSE